MRGALSFVAFCALVGCRNQAIDDYIDTQVGEARGIAERSAVYPTCKVPEEITASCGLVLKRASTEAL